MKKMLLLSLMALLYFDANAQKTSKSSFMVAVGPSFPLGDFGNKELTSEEAGLASTGGFIDLGYHYQFVKSMGLALSLKGKIYGVSKEALQGFSLPTGTGGSGSIKSTTWRSASIMTGFFQVIPLTKDKKISFELREMAGVQFSSSPEITTVVVFPGVNYSGTQESDGAASFAYQFGLGFKYLLKNNFGLKLSADYMGSKPKFDTTINSNTGTILAMQSFKQSTGAIDLGFGLVLVF